MSKRIRLCVFMVTLGLGVSTAVGNLSAATFNQNKLIDDVIFDNVNTMNAAQIDSFLNGFPNSCISTNSGFAAPDPTGYQPSPSEFFYSSTPVSAGTAIYDAAQAYGLNPQVLLATLQKEEGLVDGSGPYGCGATAMASAAGYGCTDSGTNTHDYTYPNGGLVTPLYYRNGTAFSSVTGSCVNSGPKAGFSEQLIHATWLLRFSEQRSEGNINWAVIKGNWDNSDDPQSCYSGFMTQGTWQRCPSGGSAYYDGWATIDNTAVHMDNGATAALYWYTPHFSGNQSFDTIFDNWFGSVFAPDYSWQWLGQGLYLDQTKSIALDANSNLAAGKRYYAVLTVENVGNQTWSQGAVRLATVSPDHSLGYISVNGNFYDPTWASSNRIGTFNETTVAPGQTATFEFWITAPASPGFVRDYINVVDDSVSWFQNNQGVNVWANTQPNYTWQWVGQHIYSDQTKSTELDADSNLTAGGRYYVTITVRNTSNLTWTKGSVLLATISPNLSKGYISVNGNFYDPTWASSNRIGSFQESSVPPTQTASFEFWITAPTKAGFIKDYVNVVNDSIAWFQNNQGVNVWANTPTNYDWQWLGQGLYTDQTKSASVDPSAGVAAGNRYYATLTVRNTSNQVWSQGAVRLATISPNLSKGYISVNGNFYDPTWASSNRIGSFNETTVAPGQTATFEFWITVPATPGFVRDYINLVNDSVSWFQNNQGVNVWVTSH